MSKARKSETRIFLSGQPERFWPDSVVFHGVRALMGLILAAVIVALFPTSPGVNVGRYQKGVVAERDLIAEIPFSVLKDSELLRSERDAAAAHVTPTFRFRPQIRDSVSVELQRFFARLDSAARISAAAGISDVLAAHGVEASAAQVQLLLERPAGRELLAAATRAVEDLYPGGVIDPGQASGMTGDSVRIVDGARERVVLRGQVLSGREFYDQAVADRGDGLETELLRSILARFAQPNLAIDAGRTEGDRRAARATVTGVTASVLQGEAIVRANQQVGDEEIAKLDAYRNQLRNEGIEVDGSDLKGALGGFLLNTMFLTILGLLLLFFRKPLYQELRPFVLLAGLVLVYFSVAALIDRQGIPPQAIPIVFVTIAVAVLWDGRLALVMAFFLASLTAVQQPFSNVGLMTTLLLGGAAAALSVRAFRRLAQTWVFIAVSSAAFAAAILGLGLRSDEFVVVVPLIAATASTVVGAILAVGFLPVFEWFAGVTTDQTLLGWADPNRPLLRRLANEAPGTYAHTLQVANLAEAGANAIGANALLCRVGMLYHDVGKMVKPGYFIENQQGGENPHDHLDPLTSASIVRDHVIEGIKMVKAEKVPSVLVDFVAEHHGDQSIGYFYKKAVAAAEEAGEDPPSVEDFSYPGPRPRTRETAIAMLADASESATRALQDPSEERIGNLIEGIVDARIRDGQLDRSPLTFGELAILKERFRTTLASIHHRRIDYPETRHLTEKTDGESIPDQREVADVKAHGALGSQHDESGIHGEGDGR